MARKVLYCGPVPQEGDYIGGIACIFRDYMQNAHLFSENGVEVFFQNSLIDGAGNKLGRTSKKTVLQGFFSGRYISRVAHENDIDCVHLNSSRGWALLRDLFVARSIKRRTDAFVCLSIHYAGLEDIIPCGVRGWLIRHLLRNIDNVIFLSRETMEQFVQNRIVASHSCSVLYTFYSNDPVGQSVAVRKKRDQVVFLGSLDARKGVIDLLRAFEDSQCSFTLKICGGGEQDVLDRVLSAQKAYPDNIEYMGYVTGDVKADLLCESAVFCLPSYGEGLPLAMLEAMSYGVIPVVTSVGAIPEVISDGVNGYLVSPGDVSGLVTALRDALNAPDFVRGNVLRGSQAFSLKRNVADLCSIYLMMEGADE